MSKHDCTSLNTVIEHFKSSRIYSNEFNRNIFMGQATAFEIVGGNTHEVQLNRKTHDEKEQKKSFFCLLIRNNGFE